VTATTARCARAGVAGALAIALHSTLFALGCGPRGGDEAAHTRPPAPYVSPETGFRFAPPPSWQSDRYLVTEISGPLAEKKQPGAFAVAEIQFQPSDLGHRPEVLLRIRVFPDSAWAAIEDEAGADLGSIVARARGRTYLAQMPNETPYPPGSPDAAAFEAMHLALADVKRWLTVADAAGDPASEFLPGGSTFGPAPVMYLGELSSPGGRVRPVKVIFRADSSALFSTQYRGRGVVNERGRWSLQGVYLRLQLLDDSGLPNRVPFIWAIRDSALAPVAWDEDFYGSVGLPLSLRP
jgi:hypothetical protein